MTTGGYFMPTQPPPPGKLVKPTNVKKKPAVPRLAKKTVSIPASPTPARELAFERKLAQGNAEKEKLQKQADKLNDDLHKMRLEHALWEQEQDRATMVAILTKNQLAEQKKATLLLEKSASQQRSHQAAEQKRLMQRIRILKLATKAKRVAATQTEGGADIGASAEADTQTMEELNREKVDKMLRDSDSLLTAFISELERDKVNAQNDLKFSIVQMEQRMKDENMLQLRRSQDASEKQLEQVTQQHGDQIRTMQHNFETERQRLEGRIEQLQREVESLRDSNDILERNLDEAQEMLQEKSSSLGKAESQAELSRTELIRLREFKRTVEHDSRHLEVMKSDLQKYKDINEIILSEFAKLEDERDALIEEMEKGIRKMGVVNSRRHQELQRTSSRLREMIKVKNS